MNFLEYVGLLAIVFSSTLGFILIGWSVYKHVQNVLRCALRGAVEERRDVIEAQRVKEALR